MTIAVSRVQCVAVPGAVGRRAWGQQWHHRCGWKSLKAFIFVQKISIVCEWVKNGGILSMLCGVVLCINSSGSLKIRGVKRNRFFTKIKGSMLRVTKCTYVLSLVNTLLKC